MLSNRLGRSQFLTRFGTPDTDVSSQMTDAHLVDHWVFSLHHYFCYDVHLIPVRVFQRVFDLCKNHYTNLYIIWCPRPFGVDLWIKSRTHATANETGASWFTPVKLTALKILETEHGSTWQVHGSAMA